MTLKGEREFHTSSFPLMNKKKKMPSLFNAIQIAYALGCSIAYLVGDDTMTESERKKFEVIREQKILEGMEEWM